MKVKRILSVLLTLCMVISMFTVLTLTATAPVSAATNAIYMAKLDYTSADTWCYVKNEFSLAAGSYQFDIDYKSVGSVTAAVKIGSNDTVAAPDAEGHLTIPFDWAGGSINIFLRDYGFSGTGTVYFANPVLKLVEGGNVTGDNLAWDFSRQYTEGGATLTADYAWGGKWYHSGDHAKVTMTVAKDTEGLFPERIYLAKLDYTSADTWSYVKNEFSLAAGSYQFDIDYKSVGSVTAAVKIGSNDTVAAPDAEGHLTIPFDWAGGSINIFLRDNAYTGTGTVYFANPVLKLVEGGNVTGANLVWDFYKQFTFAAATLTNAYAWGGQWYRSSGTDKVTVTVGVDANDYFAPAAPVLAPEFKTHSLVLTDSIGVNFFVDLSVLSAEEKAASYVTFAVNNGTAKTAAFDSTFVNGSGYYGFTCPVSSVQMAEAITPTLHYGTDETVVGTAYSAKDYIDYAVDHSEIFGAKATEGVALVKAIGDYGHYAQEYLGPKNSWTAGVDYTVLAKYRAADYDTDDYSAKKTATSAYEIVKDIAGTAVSNVQFTLNFDTTTSIAVRLASDETVTAATDYTGIMTKNVATGYYTTVRLAWLPVARLGDTFTVTGAGTANASGYSVSVSGLSYVYGVLDNGSMSNAAKNAVSALYDYYAAALDYLA